MDETSFKQLLESVVEGGKILIGEKRPSRLFKYQNGVLQDTKNSEIEPLDGKAQKRGNDNGENVPR